MLRKYGIPAAVIFVGFVLLKNRFAGNPHQVASLGQETHNFMVGLFRIVLVVVVAFVVIVVAIPTYRFLDGRRQRSVEAVQNEPPDGDRPRRSVSDLVAEADRQRLAEHNWVAGWARRVNRRCSRFRFWTHLERWAAWPHGFTAAWYSAAKASSWRTVWFKALATGLLNLPAAGIHRPVHHQLEAAQRKLESVDSALGKAMSEGTSINDLAKLRESIELLLNPEPKVGITYETPLKRVRSEPAPPSERHSPNGDSTTTHAEA